MIFPRFSAWQKLVALAPLLLVAVYVPGGVMLRCQVDGVLRSTPCGPQLTERRDPGPTLQARTCCDPELTQTRRPVSEAVRGGDHEQILMAALAPCATSVAPVAGPARDAGWAARRYGPAREGPSIFLARHAFLI